jgi:hypothetical protein
MLAARFLPPSPQNLTKSAPNLATGCFASLIGDYLFKLHPPQILYWKNAARLLEKSPHSNIKNVIPGANSTFAKFLMLPGFAMYKPPGAEPSIIANYCTNLNYLIFFGNSLAF